MREVGREGGREGGRERDISCLTFLLFINNHTFSL